MNFWSNKKYFQLTIILRRTKHQKIKKKKKNINVFLSNQICVRFEMLVTKTKQVKIGQSNTKNKQNLMIVVFDTKI
jgi:hypothetical protein